MAHISFNYRVVEAENGFIIMRDRSDLTFAFPETVWVARNVDELCAVIRERVAASGSPA